MIDPALPTALYAPNALGLDAGKMASDLLRYGDYQVICAVDPSQKGRTVGEVYGSWVPADRRSIPIVSTLEDACMLGARTVILGVAVAGGRIPSEAYEGLDRIVGLGLNIINGLHTSLADRYPSLRDGQQIWDIRREPSGLHSGTGKAANLKGRRLLVVGTDMGVGKMTTGLELLYAALDRGIRAAFVATGQIGIAITGSGIPLDAIRVDYAAGAVEEEVLHLENNDLIIVEGQGSLLHPGSSATLPLLRGAMPTHLILCHRAGMSHLRRAPHIAVPPLQTVCDLYEGLASSAGTHVPAKVIGISLHTGDLSDADAESAIAQVRETCGCPCADVVRWGPDILLDALLTAPMTYRG